MPWEFRTCIHGVTEGLDSHDCPKCQLIAKDLGYIMADGMTYIFTTEAQTKKRFFKKDVDKPKTV